jgi:exosortase
MHVADTSTQPWQHTPQALYVYFLITAALILSGLLYSRVVADLFADWSNDPGLSQGMLIPPLAAYIAWIRRTGTLSLPALPDNRGLFIVGLSSVLFIVGRLGAEFFLMRISLIMLLSGIVWTFWGSARLRTLALPFLLLTTMIPLPRVVYGSISAPLQLFASDAATNIVRVFGVTVYRDGNIINLATVRLGVEEACSGLNSLSSLIVGASLLGVLLCRRLSTRFALVLLAAPLAVFVNVVRITGTAVLADYQRDFALGFYHAFSGWLVFALGFFALYLVGRTLHVCFD